MKRLALLLFLLILCGCSAAPGGTQFAEQAFKDTATSWDHKAFEKIASPEYLKATANGEGDKLFALCSQQLGPLKSAEAPKLVQTNVMNSDTTQVFTIAFECEKAKGSCRLNIKHAGGAWHVMGIYVNSDALMAKLSPSASATPSKN